MKSHVKEIFSEINNQQIEIMVFMKIFIIPYFYVQCQNSECNLFEQTWNPVSDKPSHLKKNWLS